MTELHVFALFQSKSILGELPSFPLPPVWMKTGNIILESDSLCLVISKGLLRIMQALYCASLDYYTLHFIVLEIEEGVRKHSLFIVWFFSFKKNGKIEESMTNYTKSVC